MAPNKVCTIKCTSSWDIFFLQVKGGTINKSLVIRQNCPRQTGTAVTLTWAEIDCLPMNKRSNIYFKYTGKKCSAFSQRKSIWNILQLLVMFGRKIKTRRIRGIINLLRLFKRLLIRPSVNADKDESAEDGRNKLPWIAKWLKAQKQRRRDKQALIYAGVNAGKASHSTGEKRGMGLAVWTRMCLKYEWMYQKGSVKVLEFRKVNGKQNKCQIR